MSSNKQIFIRLVVIVVIFYLGLSYLPQIVGTCMDGDCGFTTIEIIISFAIPLAFIALPVALEMSWYHKGLAQALSDIGITRFSWTSIRIAVIYMVPLLLFFPVFSLLTNTSVTVQPNALWRVINIILVNGLAEEIMMRGFVFRHLRVGRSFWRAATFATAYFAFYHFPIILTEGIVVGVVAVVLAIPTGYLTAYAYERGSDTIWGPALLHAVTNALAIVLVFSGDIRAAASSLYLLVGIVSGGVITIRAYRAGYGREQAQRKPDGVNPLPVPKASA